MCVCLGFGGSSLKKKNHQGKTRRVSIPLKIQVQVAINHWIVNEWHSMQMIFDFKRQSMHCANSTSPTSLSCRPSRLWPQPCSLWRWSTHAGTCQQSSGEALSSSACSALQRPCWIPPVATRWVTAKPLDAHFCPIKVQRRHLHSNDTGCWSQKMEQLPCFITSARTAKTFTLTHRPLCPIWSHLTFPVLIPRDQRWLLDALLLYSGSKRLIKETPSDSLKDLKAEHQYVVL